MVNRMVRALLILIGIFAGGRIADAQQLVQLRFEGALEHAHLVEVEILYEVESQPPAAEGFEVREFFLHVLLAKGTSAVELGELVANRLDRDGAGLSVAPSPNQTAASLFIDRVRAVRLRVGAGLVCEVACMERAPHLVRVLGSGALDPAPATLSVTGSGAIRRRNKPPLRRRFSFTSEVPRDAKAAEIASALWESAEKVWMTERRKGNAWGPIRFLDGSVFTGLSVRLESSADWRLEIES